MIILKEISKSFKKNRETLKVLENVNLNIETGQIVHLKGNNGSGKTTLLKIIIGLIAYDSGQIIRNNIYQTDISMISTNLRSFYFRLTGYENLIYFSSLYGLNRKEANDKIKYLSNYFYSEKLLDVEFMKLSDGQRKKLSIIRAMLKDPKLILCDEVTAGLDNSSKDRFYDYLDHEVKDKNVSAIWVSHENDFPHKPDKELYL